MNKSAWKHMPYFLKSSVIVMLFSVCAIMITACGSGNKQVSNPFQGALVCKDPRPEICTNEYEPVCANKDNGIRCVTTPCPSTDKVTYANACSACADKKVFSYVPGACE